MRFGMHHDEGAATLVRRAASHDATAYGMSYLGAHELSAPSERYVYILWIVLACLGLFLGFEHFVGLTDRTIAGAVWSKWSTANHVTRILRDPRGDPRKSASPGVFRRGVHFLRRHAFLSFDLGRLTAMFVIFLPVVCLTLIGADYIDPKRGVFDTSAPVRRMMQWGIGENPAVMTERPNATLPYHTWWTIGSRAGDLSNALTPLVVIFALKQAPFALMSMPYFGSLSVHALAFLHKWGGGLLWLYATIHTVAWCIQIGTDKSRKPDIWSHLLVVPRFRWAIVAYIFLTGLVTLSIEPIRRHYYEAFYVTHVVCVFGFLIATWAHHPQLGWWMLAALLLWMLERLTRIVRVMWINYSEKPASLKQARAHMPLDTQPERKEEPMHSGLYSTSGLEASHADLPRYPSQPYDMSSAGASRVDLGWEHGSQVEGSFHKDAAHDWNDSGDVAMHPLSMQSNLSLARPATPRHVAPPAIPAALAAPFRPVVSRDLRMQLFPGYAFIQPLSGQMMRLVLRTASPIRWRPGQWLYLQLPSLSWFQSHPFTIASSFTKKKNDKYGVDPDLNDVDQLVLLLIRARGGLTRRLWDHVEQSCRSAEPQQESLAASTAFPVLGQGQVKSEVKGAFMRAIVDGPFGSSDRIDWGAYASAVIVCGGSGVSFGISVLDHLCRQIARALRGEQVRGMYGRPFHLRRVCFVWIMREFAHLQWAASAIRLCLELLPPQNLTVQIYVTHVNQKLVLPQDPGMSPAQSPQRADAATPDAPPVLALDVNAPPAAPAVLTHESDLGDLALNEGELTQFSPEEDAPLSAMDRSMNDYIMREGKMRRAKTRHKSMRRPRRGPSPPSRKNTDDPSAGFAEQHATAQAGVDFGRWRPIAAPGSLTAAANQALLSEPWSQTPAMTPGTGPGTPIYPSGSVTPMRPMSPPAAVSGSPGVMSPAPMVSSADDYFSMSPHAPGVPGTNTYPPPSTDEGHTIDMTGSYQEPRALANLDANEISDFDVVAELTRAGYPKLDALIHDEMEHAGGRTLTAACGPAGLLALIRSIVAKQISVHKVWQGDLRGHANVYTESYDS